MPKMLLFITLMAVAFGFIGAAYLLAELFNLIRRKRT